MDVPTAAAKNDEHFSKKVFANWIFLAQMYLPFLQRIIKSQGWVNITMFVDYFFRERLPFSYNGFKKSIIAIVAVPPCTRCLLSFLGGFSKTLLFETFRSVFLAKPFIAVLHNERLLCCFPSLLHSLVLPFKDLTHEKICLHSTLNLLPT